jgi:hypothetical protein
MALSMTERLMALGLDSVTAQTLASEWTPSKLRKASAPILERLGAGHELQEKIRRPPIPTGTLFALLHKAKRTCCVCRTPRMPIVVHHIVEWHLTHDHSEANLAVLCLNDHALAHTVSGMSQNLSSEMVRRHKAEWEKQVQVADGRTVNDLARASGANWDYVNLVRVFRLADDLGVNLRQMSGFDYLRAAGLITEQGSLSASALRDTGRLSLYQCGLDEGRFLYRYTSQVLSAIIEECGAVDISAISDARDLGAVAPDGTIVFVQAPFYFRNENRSRRGGPGQIRTGYARLGHSEVRFTFDAWESTSVSASTMRLTGRRVESVVGIASGLSLITPRATLQLSCLGIGSWFERIHWRAGYREDEGVSRESSAISGHLFDD